MQFYAHLECIVLSAENRNLNHFRAVISDIEEKMEGNACKPLGTI